MTSKKDEEEVIIFGAKNDLDDDIEYNDWIDDDDDDDDDDTMKQDEIIQCLFDSSRVHENFEKMCENVNRDFEIDLKMLRFL